MNKSGRTTPGNSGQQSKFIKGFDQEQNNTVDHPGSMRASSNTRSRMGELTIGEKSTSNAPINPKLKQLEKTYLQRLQSSSAPRNRNQKSPFNS